MADDSFEIWLGKKLSELELDTDIYLDYLTSVFEESSSKEEIKDSLKDILDGIIENNCDAIAEEIQNKWDLYNSKAKNGGSEEKKDISEERIKDIIEKQKAQVNKQKITKRSEVDNELKERMLASYAEFSTDDDEDDDDHDGEFANVNAQAVAQKQNEMREKMKKASDEKKIQDKLNREKEKHKKEERSEKEKKRTQKGERRSGR